MIFRRLPPVAAPSTLLDLWWGAVGLLRPSAARARLSDTLRRDLGVGHVQLVSSGRAALLLILRALGRLSPRRRVVVPAYTCFSVPAAVVAAGFDLVVCDVDPSTLDLDFRHLEALLAESPPLCVVATHLFGLAADIDRTLSVCRGTRAFVVEDAAQAFGFRAGSRLLGTLGDVGFFSFGRGKAVSAGGGGAIVTDLSDVGTALAEECRMLRTPGPLHSIAALAGAALLSAFVQPRLYWLPSSLPFLGIGETRYSTEFLAALLSGVQAGLLHNGRRRADEFNVERASRVKRFGTVSGSLAPPLPVPCLRLPFLCSSRGERDRICAAASRMGLGIGPMYPTALKDVPELRPFLGTLDLPGAQCLAERLVTVPVHHLVNPTDVEAITKLLQPAGTKGKEQCVS